MVPLSSGGLTGSSRRLEGTLETPRTTLGWSLVVVLAVVVIALSSVVGVVASRYAEGIPPLTTTVSLPSQARAVAAPGNLPWPTVGQGALAVEGLGQVATFGDEAGAKPIASTTKVMTAYVILQHRALKPGEQGPTVTINRADAERYQQAIMNDESAVEVREGETLTEYQLLQGLLLPSANNFAEILAAWDAGSTDAFVAAMNAEADRLGMTHTHFDDASGFSPRTVSTASDMLVLALAAMRDPVFADIVHQKTATLPVVGEVENTNALLKDDGVVGIKTGETDEAGDCLVFAADMKTPAGTRRAVAVILGQPDRPAVFAAARDLLRAAPSWVTTTRAVSKGDKVGTVSSAWGTTVDVVAAGDAEVTTWAGTPVSTQVTLDDLEAPLAAGAKVGTLTVSAGSQVVRVDVVAVAPIASPGFSWRITR